MDNFDKMQLEEEQAPTGYSPDVSIEQARLAVRRPFRLTGNDPVTPEQLHAEMELTRARCTPAKRIEK